MAGVRTSERIPVWVTGNREREMAPVPAPTIT